MTSNKEEAASNVDNDDDGGHAKRGGWYYLITLFGSEIPPAGFHTFKGFDFVEMIVRSRNMSQWELAPMGHPNSGFNPMLGWPSDRDFVIQKGSVLDLYGSSTSKAQVNQSDDINRSDMDLVTMPDNRTFVNWGTGNQGAQGHKGSESRSAGELLGPQRGRCQSR